ncbi:dysbindin-A-like isoform X2 [Parambassis ranga]|uniref:Dysbindin-A-like isoform X2 n=1 Tax=Parambassis ranga TaxID=210632 RepID=A0A6P7JYK9_9TELE|nr:dysbindin-A-like isoform X2 [Parambassis ranga]
MFENFKERLHMVQQDFTTSLKTLGDTKMKKRPRFEDNPLHLSAGLEILSRYEENWFLLHKRTKDCAQVAESADGDIVMLSAHWEKRRTALIQLQRQLQSLPTLITYLEGDFEEMESRLVYLETLCSQYEQQMVKQHNMNQLEAYKKKKRREVELLQDELNFEHAQKVAELEQARQQKLKERQKVYEEAFNQDVEQYLSTGYLDYREPKRLDVSVLDQMTITNTSDQEALDDFLNSTGDDISPGSSITSGPDTKSCSSEYLHKEASEEIDEPLVQLDEEDFQPDMSLVGLQDVCTNRDSDDSDSTGD